MNNSPGSVLIGVLALAAGAMLVYGGIRNKAIFGEKGIITTALRTGKLANPDSIPPMFGPGSKPTTVPGAAK